MTIDLMDGTTGTKRILIGTQNARSIWLGGSNCVVLIYDGVGYARLNQLPRVGLPPVSNNPFDPFIGL